MKLRLLYAFLTLAAHQGLLASPATQTSSYPFASVTWHHASVVAVLSQQSGGYYSDRPPGYISPGETLIINPGSPVILSSHMGSFTASACLRKGRVGLRIVTHRRTSSIRDEWVTDHYFIPAQ